MFQIVNLKPPLAKIKNYNDNATTLFILLIKDGEKAITLFFWLIVQFYKSML